MSSGADDAGLVRGCLLWFWEKLGLLLVAGGVLATHDTGTVCQYSHARRVPVVSLRLL